jgi:hypothetical protein
MIEKVLQSMDRDKIITIFFRGKGAYILKGPSLKK